jgi:hypothetical protein
MKYVISVVFLVVCMMSGAIVSLVKREDPGPNEFGIYPSEETFLRNHLWEDSLIKGDEPLDQIAQRVDEWRKNAILNLEKLKNTHVMMPSICKALRDGMYSLNDGKSITVLIPPPSGIYTEDSLHIIVVPRNVVLSNNYKSASSALYNQNDRVIVLEIDAITTPVMLGCLAHEVGHYIMHRDRKFKLDDTGTVPWITEEVNMHELEGMVLNSLTEGRWNTFVNKLAAKYQGSATEFLSSITDEDFQELEKILGIEKCGPNTASIITAQLRLQLFFNLTDKVHTGENRMVRKNQVYTTMRKLIK